MVPVAILLGVGLRAASSGLRLGTKRVAASAGLSPPRMGMSDARVTSQESSIGKEKAGPVGIAPPSPQVIYQILQITPCRNNAARDRRPIRGRKSSRSGLSRLRPPARR